MTAAADDGGNDVGDVIFGPFSWIVEVLEFQGVEVEYLNGAAFNTSLWIGIDTANDKHLVRIDAFTLVTSTTMGWHAGICFDPGEGGDGKNPDIIGRYAGRVQAIITTIDVDVEAGCIPGRCNNGAKFCQLSWSVACGVLCIPYF